MTTLSILCVAGGGMEKGGRKFGGKEGDLRGKKGGGRGRTISSYGGNKEGEERRPSSGLTHQKEGGYWRSNVEWKKRKSGTSIILDEKKGKERSSDLKGGATTTA